MKNYIGLFFTGMGIGVFLGLSKSPILLQILVPILTVIAGLLSILTGQKSNEGSPPKDSSTFRTVSPFPIMWMIIGMVVGAFLGLLAKNYDIARNRTFEVISQNSAVKSEERNQIKSESSTVLFSIAEDDCERYNLCNLKGVELLCALNEIENPEIEEFLSKKEFSLDSIKNKINLLCKCQK